MCSLTSHPEAPLHDGDRGAGATDAAVARVWAVIPCYNRPDDLARLLSDLRSLRLEGPLTPSAAAPASSTTRVAIQLALIIVDNASDPPVTHDTDAIRSLSPHIRSHLLRLPVNMGGSGGFNAGLRQACLLAARHPSPPASEQAFVWLLDSDARVEPGTLMELVAAMHRRPDAAAIGSAVADPLTGRVFEVGGRIHRRDGRFGPMLRGVAGAPGEVDCDYTAACSVLVRTDAVTSTGLMPDVFLNADDVEWFIRMRRATGRVVLCSSRSIAYHPRFDRFALAARYFVARNALNPLRVLGLPRSVLFRRAMHETTRAVGCELSGRHDLARLHLAGLRDAAGANPTGPADPTVLQHDRFLPLDQLSRLLVEAGALDAAPRRGVRIAAHAPLLRALPPADLDSLTEQIRAVATHCAPGAAPLDMIEPPSSLLRSLIQPLQRCLGGPRPHIAFVHAKALRASFFAGRWIVQIAPASLPGGRAGFVLRPSRFADRARAIRRALSTAVMGTLRAARAAWRRDPATHLEHAVPLETSLSPSHVPADRRLSLSIVVLSYNRRDMLGATLARLQAMPDLAGAEIIVVDNASSDASPEAAQAACPHARVIVLQTNVGVAAFNLGVEAARGEAVLVLDDDAWPADGAIAAATALLARRADLDAVALHPHHPATRRSEWPFALRAAAARDQCHEHWPVMGCGNLVRRSAWLAAGGYEPSFFLYRNDTDLALKLLARRDPRHSPPPLTAHVPRGVYFNPAWIVWHDSPAASHKSRRWHFLATRNWIWTARRHGAGASGVLGLTLGWLWAHKLARFSPASHWQTLRGAAAGLFSPPPPLPADVVSRGRGFARLLRLHLVRMRPSR